LNNRKQFVSFAAGKNERGRNGFREEVHYQILAISRARCRALDRSRTRFCHSVRFFKRCLRCSAAGISCSV